MRLFGTFSILGGLALTTVKMTRLLERLEKYEKIVAGTSDFLAFIDRDYKYQEINSSYLKAFGWKRDDIIGKTGEALFGSEVFKSVLKPSLARCLSGENVSYETWLDFPKMGRRYLDVH